MEDERRNKLLQKKEKNLELGHSETVVLRYFSLLIVSRLSAFIVEITLCAACKHITHLDGSSPPLTFFLLKQSKLMLRSRRDQSGQAASNQKLDGSYSIMMILLYSRYCPAQTQGNHLLISPYLCPLFMYSSGYTTVAF